MSKMAIIAKINSPDPYAHWYYVRTKYFCYHVRVQKIGNRMAHIYEL